MTDSEKELRRLAQLVQANTRDYLFFNDIETAAAVLALLDRIEALEKKVAGFVQSTQNMRALGPDADELLAAERKGAEEMRKAAAIEARGEPDYIVGGAIARAVERIPLPGDAP